MSEPVDQELRVLAAARRAFTPSPSDARRVRAALGGSLAAIPPNVAPASQSGTARVVGRLLLPALLAVGGGVVGYELGHRTGSHDASTAASASRRTTTEIPTVVTAPRKAEPSNAVEAPPGAASAPPARTPKPGAAASAAVVERRLDEEVRQLRRVEHALRNGNPRHALALLGELEREIPRGQLTEERDAASAMARCELGVGGDALAEDFAASHPGSAYAERVTETCAKGAKTSP